MTICLASFSFVKDQRIWVKSFFLNTNPNPLLHALNTKCRIRSIFSLYSSFLALLKSLIALQLISFIPESNVILFFFSLIISGINKNILVIQMLKMNHVYFFCSEGNWFIHFLLYISCPRQRRNYMSQTFSNGVIEKEFQRNKRKIIYIESRNGSERAYLTKAYMVWIWHNINIIVSVGELKSIEKFVNNINLRLAGCCQNNNKKKKLNDVSDLSWFIFSTEVLLGINDWHMSWSGVFILFYCIQLIDQYKNEWWWWSKTAENLKKNDFMIFYSLMLYKINHMMNPWMYETFELLFFLIIRFSFSSKGWWRRRSS